MSRLHDNTDMQKLAQPEKEMLKNLCRAYVAGYAMEGLGDLNPEDSELYGDENGENHRSYLHSRICGILQIDDSGLHSSRTQEFEKSRKILHNINVYCSSFPDIEDHSELSSIQINKIGKELADVLEEKFVEDGDNE